MRSQFVSVSCIMGALVGIVGATSASATTVLAQSSGLTLLGYFEAGSYQISTSGLVSLAGPLGSGFDMLPDGSPQTPVAYPNYNYFNPSGADNDLGSFGKAGPGFNLGSVLGSFSPSAMVGSFFKIGNGTTFSIEGGTNIYAVVNDTTYSNNDGFFSVSVTSVAAVPEPATWALMLAGFGMTGYALRRRRNSVSVAA